jgi:hypothetical protein
MESRDIRTLSSQADLYVGIFLRYAGVIDARQIYTLVYFALRRGYRYNPRITLKSREPSSKFEAAKKPTVTLVEVRFLA